MYLSRGATPTYASLGRAALHGTDRRRRWRARHVLTCCVCDCCEEHCPTGGSGACGGVVADGNRQGGDGRARAGERATVLQGVPRSRRPESALPSVPAQGRQIVFPSRVASRRAISSGQARLYADRERLGDMLFVSPQIRFILGRMTRDDLLDSRVLDGLEGDDPEALYDFVSHPG